MAQPLRRQIILLDIAVLIPVFVAAAWSTRETYQEQVKQLESEALALSRSLVVYLQQGLDVDEVEAVIRTVPLPDRVVVTISDERNTVLASSTADPSGEEIHPPSFPSSLRSVPVVAMGRYTDGVDRVYGNTVFEPGPLLISVGIPTALARERMDPFLRRNIAIALGATWLTLLLEFLLLRPYKRAFDRASGFASRVAAGDLSRPTTIRMPSQEMDHLQNSLVTMVDSLREARARLAAQIDDERRIREELQALQRQVIRRERLAAIGILASGVAHELNNPLQAILGSSELLQVRDDIPAPARSDLAMIQKESARASAIIRNLSRFSRQQTGLPAPVRLYEVVASAVELRQRQAAAREIQLEISSNGAATVSGVFEELQQVVLNYVINAEHAVSEQEAPRRIAIDIHQADGRARVEVHDNGPGVSDEHEARLFQPFFTTKPSGEGTGLGLSLSYVIVQSHGGTVGYRRSRLGGAMFFLDLPAAPNELPA